jgi:hypothetical protein
MTWRLCRHDPSFNSINEKSFESRRVRTHPCTHIGEIGALLCKAFFIEVGESVAESVIIHIRKPGIQEKQPCFASPFNFLSTVAPRLSQSTLDFVCVCEADRPLLLDHFDARLAGKQNKFPLPVRRFRRLRILWQGSTLHFDDKHWPRKGERARNPSEIEITVKPSALTILQPAAAATA